MNLTSSELTASSCVKYDKASSPCPYEKGKRLVERGTGSSISLGKESLERAISMYERDGYEDSDKLCGSYLRIVFRPAQHCVKILKSLLIIPFTKSSPPHLPIDLIRDAAMAHAFLAMAYGYLEPPGKQELLEQGELALSYFTQLETVDSEDPPICR